MLLDAMQWKSIPVGQDSVDTPIHLLASFPIASPLWIGSGKAYKVL